MTKTMLDKVAGSNVSVQLRKGGKFVPTLKPGETQAEYQARISEPKAPRKAAPPFARVEKAALAFAKRFFRKAMTKDELTTALDFEDATGTYEETSADEYGAELLVTVSGGEWEVQIFVFGTTTARGARWKFGAPRLRSIRLINTEDADAAEAWFNPA